jgi:uncharacterized membrane protein
MEQVLTIVRVVAILSTGLLAGIFVGYRAGPQPALHKLSLSSFIQFQQGVHVRYVRFMPVLNAAAVLSVIAWLVLIRSRWTSAEFWLIAVSLCGVVANAGMTRAVSIPLNNRLMTWNSDAPPENLREMWAPWDRVNTIRSFLSTVALSLEAVALTMAASSVRL